MGASEGYLEFALGQLEQITPVTWKKMFGGVGIYADGLFFALISDDPLYFKVDDSNRPDFEAAGMEPFRPYGDDRAMGYYEVPIDVLEDVDELRGWVRQAIDVARRSRA